MDNLMEDRAGQQLGNYRLLRLLRRESTMDVYLGEHVFLKTQVAIKVLSKKLSPQEMEVFLAATREIARLKHPNILRVLEFGVEGRTPFLVTDYTPNRSLRQLYPTGTPVPPDRIVFYVKQITVALQYIHAYGLVHRGVRPENIFLGPQGRILLSDFSSTVDVLNEASTRDALGSEEESAKALIYVAPEQLQGKPSPASDQYALGVVVYEWVSDNPPFQNLLHEIEQRSHTPLLPQTKTPQVFPELAHVLATAMAKDAQQRFANITAFASAMEQILQPTPLPGNTLASENGRIATAPQALTNLSNKKRIRPGVARGIGISLILMVLLLIGGFFLFPRQTTVITTAQATQTAVARATQKAIATFTARSPQAIYTAATSGNPTINDPLNDKSKSAWESVQAGSNSSCTFERGIYAINVPKAGYYLNCESHKNNFHNFAFEVEMSIVKGDNGALTFRSNSAAAKFYALKVTKIDSTSFFCTLVLYNNKGTKQLQDTLFNGNTQKFNLLSVIAYEQFFYFYLNKEFFAQVQDSTLQTGAMGMYTSMSATNNTPAEADFRNAKVWIL